MFINYRSNLNYLGVVHQPEKYQNLKWCFYGYPAIFSIETHDSEGGCPDIR